MKVSKRDLILESIIKEYIKSKTPIGSSELKGRMTLDISPSTIRIYFKQLSEEGALIQLHVSSGRIPTQSALREYWLNKINPEVPIAIEDIEKMQNSIRDYGLYCIVKKNKNSTFSELMRVSDRFLILVFDEDEIVLKYHPKIEKFLNSFIGCSMQDLKKISAAVGLYELRNKLEQIFLQTSILKEGKDELYKIAQELDNEEFIEKIVEPGFLDSLNVGMYFDDFVPNGCMAVKHNANMKDDDLQMFCLGKLDSDFESFFKNAKE
ncbi:MAG: HrcA family transcriptional regulator [Sulfurospirillaceae bacterium]|nr:HrcA family transcriptional regulator [Sulfurospirillaceae bacterium]